MTATAEYRGATDVMHWCGGVTRAAVGMWIIRHPGDIPQPKVAIVNEGTDQVTRGWSLDQKDEWMAFAAARLGPDGSRTARATSARAVRRAAEMITRQAESGEISERAAIELLAALIGTTPVTTTEEGPS